jgi:hypothetical protein
MSKTFDTYCIEATDLESARERLEAVLSIRFALHESMFWGGDYYLIRSGTLGEITIRRNHNSYTRELNEPDYPDCQIIVSVSVPLDPDALAARLTEGGLRLLNRSII